MAKLIKVEGLGEGEIFCTWIKNRFRKNKNVLKVTSGATGSGKSYQDLRQLELHYKNNLNREVPPENICFSISEIMERLTSGKLNKGDILILEEAGANLGSLDFQTKISKMFTYVLQSFRSMNIGIFFNLPYLGMLNKTARLLIHAHFSTAGIDYENGVSICKPFFIQVNQSTGKMYSKYLRVRFGKRVRSIKRFSWQLPSKDLVEIYERKKANFLSDLTTEFRDKLREMELDEQKKLQRKELEGVRLEVYNLACEGLNQTEIARKLGKAQSTVNGILKTIKKYGYSIQIKQKSLGNSENRPITQK